MIATVCEFNKFVPLNEDTVRIAKITKETVQGHTFENDPKRTLADLLANTIMDSYKVCSA